MLQGKCVMVDDCLDTSDASDLLKVCQNFRNGIWLDELKITPKWRIVAVVVEV